MSNTHAPLRSIEPITIMEMTEEVAEQIMSLWLQWQSGKPTHQRLFFNFFEDAVRPHPELNQVSLLDTLSVLNAMAGIRPQQ